MFRGQQYQMEMGAGITGHHLALVSKPSRQKRKGPIIRFGRKPEFIAEWNGERYRK